MTYNYKEASFAVPADYNTGNFSSLPQLVGAWILANFPNFSLKNIVTHSTAYYMNFTQANSKIILSIGVYSSSGSYYWYMSLQGTHSNPEYGSLISDKSTVHVAILELNPVAAMLSFSIGSKGTRSVTALMVKELATGEEYVFVHDGSSSSLDSITGFNSYLPNKYVYLKDGKTTNVSHSMYPSTISELKGSVSKEAGHEKKCAMVSPLFYLSSSPLGICIAKNDCLKLIVSNDGLLPTTTGAVPIQIGTGQYIAISDSTNLYIKTN